MVLCVFRGVYRPFLSCFFVPPPPPPTPTTTTTQTYPYQYHSLCLFLLNSLSLATPFASSTSRVSLFILSRLHPLLFIKGDIFRPSLSSSPHFPTPLLPLFFFSPEKKNFPFFHFLFSLLFFLKKIQIFEFLPLFCVDFEGF